jgi:signal transduction histidine kinase
VIDGLVAGRRQSGRWRDWLAAVTGFVSRTRFAGNPIGNRRIERKRKSPLISGLGGWASPQRLIDVGRLVASVIAVVAICADPTRPTVNVRLTYIIMAAYVVFAALVVLLLPRRRLNDPIHLISTAADILFLGILAAITEELESPFFAFFTFVLISSAIRWGWPGVFAAGFILQILLLVIGIPDVDDADPAVNMLIMRSSSCWIATFLLGYFGSYRGRSEYRLRELAAWPHEIVPEEGWPWLETALQHAANVLGTERIMVIWRDRDAADGQIAWWTGSECRFEDKVPAIICDALMGQAAAGRCTFDQLADIRGALRSRLPDVERHVFGSGNEITYATSLKSIRFQGCVLIVEPAYADEDIDSLARIIASRIAMELEHFALVCSFAAEARLRERAHLAHDLHDSVLQDLTAAVLQIDEAVKKLPSTHDPLCRIGDLLRSQQAKIRRYVTESRADMSERKYLRNQLLAFAAPLARQWDCKLTVAIDPLEIEVTERLAMELCLALSEATANAVRHGGARTVEVAVKARDDRLLVEISNDGDLVTDPSGLTLRSLQRRVASLAGTLLAAERGGRFALLIDLPFMAHRA